METCNSLLAPPQNRLRSTHHHLGRRWGFGEGQAGTARDSAELVDQEKFIKYGICTVLLSPCTSKAVISELIATECKTDSISIKTSGLNISRIYESSLTSPRLRICLVYSNTIGSTLLRPSRLDQFIHIPLLNEASRMSVFKAALNKSLVAPEVN
jgi:hypothetical protein